MAVDLLYQVNYVGPPYQREDANIFEAIVMELETDMINHLTVSWWILNFCTISSAAIIITILAGITK